MANKLSPQFISLQCAVRKQLQLLCMYLALTDFFCIFSLFYITLLLSLLSTPYFYITILYFIWMLYDRNSLNTGGHLQWWYRGLSFWRHCAEYFPVKLYKTADLDANKNYIIGYHPHGIIAQAAYLNFSTNATNFRNKYPGITSRVLSLNMHYLLPIHREITAFSGTCGSSKQSLQWILTKNGKGNAAVIVVGGAEEALDAMPNTMVLTLKNKKGFIKMALRYGASLVPCVSFGENDVYSHIKFNENSWFRRMQKKFLKLFTFSSPIFYGRGVSESIVGYLPYRKPINTVVGKPINVEKIEEPTQEDIDKLHAIYIKALCDLFYAYREKLSENPKMEIVIK